MERAVPIIALLIFLVVLFINTQVAWTWYRMPEVRPPLRRRIAVAGAFLLIMLLAFGVALLA